jgi:hypothetical protein
MGFLDGFLGGVVEQRNKIAAQNRQDAEQSQAREDAVLQHLLTSDRPEFREIAAAGILDSTNPKRKQGGFGGWLGKVQANPQMDRLRALIAQDAALGKAGVPNAAGPPTEAITATPTAGPAGPSLAQTSAKSLTEVGSAPPSPTAPVEGQDPTPETAAPSRPLAGVLQATASTVDPAKAAALATTAPPVAAGVPQTGVSAEITSAGGDVGPQVGPATAPVPAVGAPPPGAPGPTPAGAPPLAVLGQPTPPVGKPAAAAPKGDIFRSPETQVRLSKKAAAQGDVEGEIAGLVSSGFSEPEARALIKAKMERTARGGVGASGFQSVAGEVIDPETGKKVTAFGAFDKAKGAYVGTDPDSPFYGIPIPGFTPRATVGSQPRSYGQDREAIAKSKYGLQFKDLNQEQATDVIAEEKKVLEGKATARGTGAATAKFDAPITVQTAQQTNTTVGATSRQYAGQEIASEAEQGQRRGVEQVKTQLDHVKGLIAAALPKQGELAGLAPGATLAIRRRSPQYREHVARLESALDNIVNVLARTVGQQRGAQTEQDASRAYNTVVALKGRLLDPLAGDTQESAAARINETLQYLDVVLSKLPATPVPGAGAGVAPGAGEPPPAPGAAPGAPAAVATAAPARPAAKAGATAGPGPAYTMVNGVLHKDGKPY